MQQYELIENYLSNNLNATDRIAFENRLLNDKEFAEDFAMYKSIESAMQKNTIGDEDGFKENLSPFQKEYFKTNVVSINKNAKMRKIVFAAIGAAAILVLIFTLIPNNNKKLSNEDLYAKYAVPETVENTVRGTVEKTDLQNGIDLYNEKKYSDAIPYFEKVKDSSAEAMLLLGISYTQINNYTKAHISYDNIIKGGSVFVEKAIWYKSLAYLKNKELSNCKLQLNKLLNSETYKKNVATILKNL